MFMEMKAAGPSFWGQLEQPYTHAPVYNPLME